MSLPHCFLKAAHVMLRGRRYMFRVVSHFALPPTLPGRLGLCQGVVEVVIPNQVLIVVIPHFRVNIKFIFNGAGVGIYRSRAVKS